MCTLHQGSGSASGTATRTSRRHRICHCGRQRGRLLAGAGSGGSHVHRLPLPVDRGRGRWRRGGGGCGGSAGGGGSAGSSSRGICSSLKTLSWYCLNCNRHRPWGGCGRDYFSRACVRSKGVGGKAEALTVFSSRACVLKAEGHYSSKKKRLKGTTVFSRGREYEI